MPLLVHGVVPSADADGLPRSALAEHVGGEVDVIAYGDVAGVVSAADDPEVPPTRANLLGHASLLDALAQHTSVLPMRFGVVVADADTLVGEHLAPRHDTFDQALDRLRDKLELRLRGRYVEEAVLPELVASDRRAARLRGREDLPSKLELGERIVANLEARRAVDAQRAVDALQPHAQGAVPGATAEPLDAFSCSFLVARAELEAFDRAVDALGEAMAPAVQLELVGPMPPYSFVVAEEG